MGGINKVYLLLMSQKQRFYSTTVYLGNWGTMDCFLKYKALVHRYLWGTELLHMSLHWTVFMQQLSQRPINGHSLPWPSSAHIYYLLTKAIGKKGRITYNS